MTAISRAAATASLVGAAWGCGATTEPGPALIAVSPPMAYNDTSSPLLIEGGPFRPAYGFDTMSARSSTEVGAYRARLLPGPGAAGTPMPPIELESVSWLSIGALSATLPSGIPAGSYDVDVIDPRGQHTRLGGAFSSLGPDLDPPTVMIQSPRAGALIGAQTTVTLTLAADDGAGLLDSLSVMVMTATASFTGTCTIPPATAATLCHFQFVAPPPSGDLDSVVVDAQATDSARARHTAHAQASFRLAPRPSLTGLAPSVGPASGGTQIDITGADFIVGADPFEGSTLLMDGVPLPPELVTIVSSTQITAFTPGHDAGYATLAVATGDATTAPMYFEFVATPIVKTVSPARGPLSGGTWIAVVGSHFRVGATVILVDGTPLGNPCFVSANRIEGVVPPGAAGGPVSIVASDPIGGEGELPDAFTYDTTAPDLPDGGAEPMSCGGGGPS